MGKAATAPTRDQREAQLASLIAGLGNGLDAIARKIIGSHVTPQAGLADANQVLFRYHLAAAMLGLGLALDSFGAFEETAPRLRVNPLPVVARTAAAQAAFLRGFLADVEQGRYSRLQAGGTGAQARKGRALLYGQRLVGTANQLWLEAATAAGLDVAWVLGEADQHCSDCRYEAGQGWQPAYRRTRVPGDGSTRCLVRCRCHLETRGLSRRERSRAAQGLAPEPAPSGDRAQSFRLP